MKLSFYTKFLPTIALLLLLFNGCSTDDVIGSTNNDMDHLPNLYGHIVDANTNTSLDSVMIIGSGSTTTYTDSNGFYMFENLNYGDYTFVVSDSGYATIISSFNLQIPLVNDDDGMLADNANDLVLDALHHEHNMSLVTLSAGLSGTVYKTVNNSTVPADIATVTIDFGNNYMPSIYMTTTDNLGKYSFSNLPATNASQTVRVLPHNDGTYDYNSATLNAILRYGPVLANHNITVEENEGVVYVTNNNIETGASNTSVFGIDDNISVSFTHPMNSATVQIELKQGSTIIPVTASWTDAYNLEINPDEDLSNGTAYTIKITGYATDGASLIWGAESFTTIGYDGIELLSTNADIIDDGVAAVNNFSASSNVELTFNKAPDMTIPGTYVYLYKGSVDQDNLIDAVVTTLVNVITINPAMDLLESTTYKVDYNVASVAGDFTSTAYTFNTVAEDVENNQITLLSTNADIQDDGSDAVTNFSTGSNLELTFSKTPDMTIPGTYVDLYRGSVGAANIVDADVTISGNVITINPVMDLANNQAYIVNYNVASVAGNFTSTTYTFVTVLDNVDVPMYLLSSNVVDEDGNEDLEFPTTLAIKLAFSMLPASGGPTTCTLTDVGNSDQVATTLTVSATGDTLIITPNGELKDDQSYRYSCTVYANGAVDTDGDGNCDSGDACIAVAATSFETKRSYTTVPAVVTIFAKDPTITSFADDLTSYSFEWTGVANATGYYIYAKDSHNNTDYVRVSGSAPITISDNLNGTAGAIDIGLITQFDRYSDDADQTPLAGITLSFMITAVNYYGESTPSTAVTFVDNATPVAVTPAQPATADNSGDAINAKTITVTVGFDEIMDVSTAIAVTIAEAGGDAAYVLPSTAITATWDDGGRGLTLTIVVPAGKMAAGDVISLAATQFKDLTGNSLNTSIIKTLDY